jgi:hypothetical protein
MERFVRIPFLSAKRLKEEKASGPGYWFVSIRLKDGRCYEPAVASEGHIIEVKGYEDLPFTSADVESVAITEKRWNFRRKKPDRSESAQANRRHHRLGA